MPSIAFEYKCRRCGRIDRNPHTAEPNGPPTLISAIMGKPHPFPGFEVRMLDVHTCPDKGMGVTDLIGYSIED